MKLIKFIKENKNWKELLTQKPYCLKISQKDKYYLFKYNQLESDFSEPIVRESRGVILYNIINNEWIPVCRPFDKFFNYGEPHAAKLDWNNIKVTEKIDGSIIKVWYHANKWHISTNGMIDAKETNIQGFVEESFYKLFKEGILRYYTSLDEFFQYLCKKNTYMFELVSPKNRVVIPYETTDIYYLAARNTLFGHYVKDEIPYLPTPKVVKAKNIDEVVAAARSLDWQHEGYVCFDGKNRVKVKSNAYVLAHYARNNNVMTWERLVDIVLNHEEDEFLVYAEEYKDKINYIKKLMNTYDNMACEEIFLAMSYMFCPRKEYAAYVKTRETIYQNFLFKFYLNNYLTWEEYTKDWNAAKWVKMLLLKEKAEE